MKHVAIYARVSTREQSTAGQISELREFAERMGWAIAGVHEDVGISGKKARRPGLDALLDQVRKRRVDAVLVTRFDRFSRGLRHLVETLDEFQALGVDFVSFQESIDTSTPLGRAMFGLIATLAEMERELVRERVKLGVRAARKRGARIGRPRAEVSRIKVMQLRGQGLSIRQIALKTGASSSTVHRLLASA